MAKPLIGITANIKEEKDSLCYVFPENYFKRVKEAGGKPFCVYPNMEDLETYIEKLDGLIIPGCGQDINPSYYGEEQLFEYKTIDKRKTDFEIKIVKEFYKIKKPVLGICHGCQLVNVAFGGSLYQHIPAQLGKKVKHTGKEDVHHKVKLEKNSYIKKVLKRKSCKVNSRHHQGIKQIGKELKGTAYSKDGLCEAIENDDGLVLGLQWHPERMENKDSYKIFETFLESCKK